MRGVHITIELLTNNITVSVILCTSSQANAYLDYKHNNVHLATPDLNTKCYSHYFPIPAIDSPPVRRVAHAKQVGHSSLGVEVTRS